MYFPQGMKHSCEKNIFTKKTILTEFISDIPVTGVLFVTQQHILDVGLLLNKQ